MRHKDVRDIQSNLNQGIRVVPQAIYRDIKELAMITDIVKEAKYSELDLNLGCPFPLQMRKGRGAAALLSLELLEQTAEFIKDRPEICFSIKMRLGVDSADEGLCALEVINKMKLDHITIHGRLAEQQYSGEPMLREMRQFAKASAHPVIFNGNLFTPSAIDDVMKAGYAGAMVGRGLLMRPSLLREWKEQRDWSREERIESLLRLHAGIYAYYCETLCGDAQILSKTKPFWQYLEQEIGHKIAKAIKKANTLSKYESAISLIE